MRVAYVCADPGVPVYGTKGSSVHVQEVVRALCRRGASVELFATRVDGDPPAGLEDMPLHQLPAISKGEPAERERRAVAANAELHGALEEAGTFDLVYERYALWSFAGMSYACQHGIPGILEVNAPLTDEQARHRHLVDRDRAEWIARALFDLATAVVAVSEPVAGWVRARTSQPETVHVIPNGVDPRRFSTPAQDRRDTAFTVGFVGTLKPWHGVDTLVRACAQLQPGCRLLIVGDGPQRQALATLVEDCGLAGVTSFTGAVDPTDIPALLGRMDVATAPYGSVADDYFSPLKVCEYLAAGLPVVASAVGQVEQTLRHGVTGLLTRPGDVTALAGALEELRRDPQRRSALGREGRRWVLENRTWDAVASRILELAAPVPVAVA